MWEIIIVVTVGFLVLYWIVGSLLGEIVESVNNTETYLSDIFDLLSEKE